MKTSALQILTRNERKFSFYGNTKGVKSIRKKEFAEQKKFAVN